MEEAFRVHSFPAILFSQSLARPLDFPSWALPEGERNLMKVITLVNNDYG